jgi:hypothetical protein
MKLGKIGIGRKIYDRKSGMLFRVAAQDHYGEGITTLLANHVVAVRALDAAEPGKKRRYPYESVDQFGNNNYPLSNLHQWLNSADETWYHPTHKLDTPPEASGLRYGEHPYDAEPGFLARFSDTLRSNLVETDIPVLVRTGRGTGELQTVRASVFLPSRTEMNKGDELGIAEGRPLPIFYDHYIFKATPSQDQLDRYGRSWNPEEPEKGLFYDQAQLYDPKFGWWYYMRTPSTLYAYLERVLSPYGAVSYTYANNDVVGLRPLLNLNADTEVADVGVEEPYYRIG